MERGQSERRDVGIGHFQEMASELLSSILMVPVSWCYRAMMPIIVIRAKPSSAAKPRAYRRRFAYSPRRPTGSKTGEKRKLRRENDKRQKIL